MHFTQVPWFATLLSTPEGRNSLADRLYLATQQDDDERRESICNLIERMIEWQASTANADNEQRGNVSLTLVLLRDRLTHNEPQYLMAAALLDIKLYRIINFGHSQYRLREFLEKFGDAEDVSECMSYLEDALNLVRCEDCGEYEFSECTTTDYSHDEICRECIDDHYTYSEWHDCHVHNDCVRRALDQDGDTVYVHENCDDFHWDEDLEMYVHYDYRHEPEVIGSYHSSKSEHRPIKDDWSTKLHRWLGVELEVEARDINHVERAKQLHEVLNGGERGSKVFFERDGSLTNGFEIISQPMSLPAHRELWQWVNDRSLVAGLRSHNTSTCGLHVHVNRDALSGLQIARIVTFVNDPNNEQLIKAIARRYAEGYCKIKVKKLDDVIEQLADNNDRYEAVNITPRRTIEFRIFKGTLKYESLMAAVEFANAMVDFSDKMKTASDLTTQNFMTFINEDAKDETPYLRPYIEQRLELA